MIEWVQFWIVAALLAVGTFCFVAEVIGVFRFGFVMNRIHAVGIGDTMGLFFVVLALMVSSGLNFTTLKLFLLILFMWVTSPTSSHFLSKVEVNTNRELGRYVRKGDTP